MRGRINIKRSVFFILGGLLLSIASYAQTIDIQNPSLIDVCQNAPFDIEILTTGTFDPANIFTVELSDQTGSFASAIDLGSLTESATGNWTIPAIIPDTTAAATYLIRVTGDPDGVISDNTIQVIVLAAPEAVIYGDTELCEGETLTLVSDNGVSYQWTGPNSFSIGGDSFSIGRSFYSAKI